MDDAKATEGHSDPFPAAMRTVTEFSPNDVVMRRIPIADGIVESEVGQRRANSFRLQPRRNEEGASCVRLAQCSPRALLEAVQQQGLDPAHFTVCRFFVSDIIAVGYHIVDVPDDALPGHCEIRAGTAGFAKGNWSKLALKTRILTDDEINSTPAGGVLS